MPSKWSQLVPVKPGEWRLALALLVLLAINTLVLELSDVVATSGFVGKAGPSQLPWLWLMDMVVTLILAGGYALVVDRMARVRLVTWLLGGLALVYLVIHVMFTFGAPEWVNYLLLYIIADQQWIIFPLAFWAMANDVYSMSEAKRLFPVIGAGVAIGSIAGNGLAAGSAMLLSQRGQDASQLLIVCAIMFLVSMGLLWMTFRNRPVRARQSAETETNVRETVQVGVDFFQNVPLFRYLALTVLLSNLALTIVRYHFFFTIDHAFADELHFQAFYGIYNVLFVVASLLVQWLIAGRLLEKTPLKNTFMVLPVLLLVAAAGALAVSGLMGAAAAPFLAWVAERAWDEPARKSVQGLVPDERRGRVSTFMDTYFLAIATMMACLILSALLALPALGWLSESAVTAVYLTITGGAALGAVGMAWRLRAVYDQSLLNWRLSRSRRKSVLDGLEF